MGENIKKYKKTIITIIIALILVFGFVIIRFYTNSMIEYAEVENNTIQTILNHTNDYTEDARSLSNRLSDENHLQEIILSGNVNLSEFSQTAVLARSLLANSRMVIESQHHPKKGEMSADINFQLQRSSLMKAEMYQDSLYTAVKLPFDSKAFGIKNDRFGEWMFTQHDRRVLDELPGQKDHSIDLNLFDYVRLFQFLQETDTQKQSNVSFSDGVYQKVTMNVTPKQAESLIELLTDEIESSKSNFNPRVVNVLNQLSFPNGLTYEAYFTNESVRFRKISGAYNFKGSEYEFKIDLDTKLTGDQYRVKLNSHIEKEGAPLIVSYQEIGQPQSDEYTVNRSITIDQEDQSEINWKTRYSDNLKEIKFDLNTPLISPKVEGDLDIKTNTNKDEGHKSYQGEVFFNNVRTTIDINQNIEFIDDININKIEAQNVRFLDQMSIKEYDQWFNGLKSKTKEYMDQIIQRFNPF